MDMAQWSEPEGQVLPHCPDIQIQTLELHGQGLSRLELVTRTGPEISYHIQSAGALLWLDHSSVPSIDGLRLVTVL